MSSSKQHLDEGKRIFVNSFIPYQKEIILSLNAEKAVKKAKRTFFKNLDQIWEKIKKKWPSLIVALINEVEHASSQ